jgi:hypothetical protein
MKILFEDAFLNVTISWSRPMLYENLISNGSSYDETAYLYMISGKYHNHPNKVFYIGKTYNQTVSNRLTQKDHKKRYDALKKEYPRHKLFVSHGNVQIHNGNVSPKRIDQIESILIYSMPGEHSINKMNFWSHGVKNEYLLTNKGYKNNLESTIGLGVFVK